MAHVHRKTRVSSSRPSTAPDNEWARQRWRGASSDWLEDIRGRVGYRATIVRPTLLALLEEVQLSRSDLIVDLGCAEGLETAWLHDALRLEARGVRVLAIDQLANLINEASRRFARDGISYIVEDATTSAHIEGLVRGQKESVRLVTSQFVLHDDARGLEIVRTAKRMLAPGGLFVAVIVHPSWGEALLREGSLRSFATPALDDAPTFRWAAEFPMVRNNEEPYYLPYFSRSLRDYAEAFELAGFSEFRAVELPIDKKKLSSSDTVRRSDSNPYWPSISLMPTSVILLGRA